MDERRPEGGRSSPILEPRTSEWVENTCQKRSHSLKVFGTAMVSAWRRRGEDIQQLEKETLHLKNQCVQHKSTVRVCKAMMQVEHERNGDLHLELKMSQRSSDEVQTSILNLTADKEKLLHEVECHKREHNELQVVADQKKIELCAALIEQSIDKGRLSQDEEAINQLRRQNANLVTEVATLRRMQMEYKMCEQRLTKELKVANERLNTMQEELNRLQDIIRGWNSNEPQETEPQKHPMMNEPESSISNDSLQKNQPLHVLENAFIYIFNILSWALVRFRF